MKASRETFVSFMAHDVTAEAIDAEIQCDIIPSFSRKANGSEKVIQYNNDASIFMQ